MRSGRGGFLPTSFPVVHPVWRPKTLAGFPATSKLLKSGEQAPSILAPGSPRPPTGATNFLPLVRGRCDYSPLLARVVQNPPHRATIIVNPSISPVSPGPSARTRGPGRSPGDARRGCTAPPLPGLLTSVSGFRVLGSRGLVPRHWTVPGRGADPGSAPRRSNAPAPQPGAPFCGGEASSASIPALSPPPPPTYRRAVR